jgi:hypothetical protein
LLEAFVVTALVDHTHSVPPECVSTRLREP